MTEKEILKTAIEKLGEESQIDKSIEECSELIQALCKYKRALQEKIYPTINNEIIKNLYGEIADVKIMIKQLEILFDKNAISEEESFKIARLERYLETL